MLLSPACGMRGDWVDTTMTQDEIATSSQASICDSEGVEVYCHAHAIVDATGKVIANATPAGFTPSQLRSAYSITGSGKSTTLIAVISAYDYATAEADLATYRSQFGLPACTSASGCFRKVDQNGGTSYGGPNASWNKEAALDLDMVSAMCPNCKIVLVEATEASFADLAAAANEGAKLGAHVLSNSYGGDEFGTDSYESAYNHAGVAVVASSGDAGYFGGIEFPASSPHVISVGGTSLATASNRRGWTETAWDGGGSGCSTVYAKPAWQRDTGCTMRMLNDVSAVADPNTGVAVYGPDDTGVSSWIVLGGTSVAAPLIAGVYGVNGGSVNYGSNPYSCLASLNDVTTGSTSAFCDPTYACTAGRGYDGPTGLGTPSGSTAF
ncbi:MAG TPA: S53 family peptidase [Kofleriaceae bacterium]|nr:S53 family peptidase [Kofleriaceae bacterium]